MTQDEISHFNSNVLQQRLTALVEYSRDLLKQAQAGNWSEVIGAQPARDQDLHAFYAEEGVAKLPGITEATQELLSINQSLERLALTARQTAVNEAVSIGKGRRAVQAYAQNAR